MIPKGRRERLVLLGRVLLGSLFLYAAIQKLADPSGFAEAIDGYRLIPSDWSGWFAVLVPSTEVVLGIALVSGYGSRAGGLLAGLMLAAFSVAIAQALGRGINIECGCFGSSAPANADYLALVRNVALITIAVIITLSPEVRWGASDADG